MIISDLQYIETANNEEVQGGFSFSFADALANSVAVGDIAVSLDATSAVAVPGGAASSSRSTAASVTFHKKGGKKNGGKGGKGGNNHNN